MVTASQLLAAPSASDRSSAASIPADRTSNLSSTPSRSSRLSVTRASVASNVKRASTTARMTLLDTARSSLLYAVSALGWAILMCLPSLALIGARYPLLNAWGWSLIKHDPLLEHPPNPEYHLGGAPASAADIPSEHFTLGWLAHLEEGVEVNTQLLAALMFVVLHVTLTHAKAAEQEFRSVRKLVLMSAAPLMVTQMVGRVLSFSSPMLATALIWLPAWFVLVMVGRRCSEPLGCNNFFWCLSFEHAGFWLLGICYMYVLVPLVMVSQPGRQVVYLVIALPVIKTAATMTSRFGGFCATGLPAEHKMVFGLIVPCARTGPARRGAGGGGESGGRGGGAIREGDTTHAPSALPRTPCCARSRADTRPGAPAARRARLCPPAYRCVWLHRPHAHRHRALADGAWHHRVAHCRNGRADARAGVRPVRPRSTPAAAARARAHQGSCAPGVAARRRTRACTRTPAHAQREEHRQVQDRHPLVARAAHGQAPGGARGQARAEAAQAAAAGLARHPAHARHVLRQGG